MPEKFIRTQGDLQQAIRALYQAELPLVLNVESVNAGDSLDDEAGWTPDRNVRPIGQAQSGLENRAYVNERDRIRDAQFQQALDNLWLHNGSSTVAPGAVVMANLLNNIRNTDNLPETNRSVVELNPVPEGNSAATLGEAIDTPGAHFIVEVDGQSFAVVGGEAIDGLDSFAINSRQFQLTLLSTTEGGPVGLGIWNSSLGEMLLRLLQETVERIVGDSNESENETRLISMNISNINNVGQSVDSGDFQDTPQNRVAIVRTLMDEMMLAMNSSDMVLEGFHTLDISVNVRYPDRDINPVSGNGVPTWTLNDSIPPLIFPKQRHNRLRFHRKAPGGQLLYVENETFCWAVAIRHCLTVNQARQEILSLEYDQMIHGAEWTNARKKIQRSNIKAVRNEVFAAVEKSAEEALQETRELFSAFGLDLERLEATEETFQTIAQAFEQQIVIVDEAGNYENTLIYPYATDPETGERVTRYDELQSTIYLLRTRYPLVPQSPPTDNMRRPRVPTEYHHFHGLLSPNALLYERGKRICLHCRSLFSVYWNGHMCEQKSTTNCQFCQRSQLSPELVELHRDRVSERDLFYRDFCMTHRETGENNEQRDERWKCRKCQVYCRNERCLELHKRNKKCHYRAKCEKCGAFFACRGQLAPKEIPVKDRAGNVVDYKVELPKEHIDCTWAFCLVCNIWGPSKGPEKHICRSRRPIQAKKFPRGLGSVSIVVEKRLGRHLSIASSAVAFHSNVRDTKNVDYCLLTELGGTFKGGDTNLVHAVPSDVIDREDILKPELFVESLPCLPKAMPYNANYAGPTRWADVRAAFDSAPTAQAANGADGENQELIPNQAEFERWNAQRERREREESEKRARIEESAVYMYEYESVPRGERASQVLKSHAFWHARRVNNARVGKKVMGSGCSQREQGRRSAEPLDQDYATLVGGMVGEMNGQGRETEEDLWVIHLGETRGDDEDEQQDSRGEGEGEERLNAHGVGENENRSGIDRGHEFPSKREVNDPGPSSAWQGVNNTGVILENLVRDQEGDKALFCFASDEDGEKAEAREIFEGPGSQEKRLFEAHKAFLRARNLHLKRIQQERASERAGDVADGRGCAETGQSGGDESDVHPVCSEGERLVYFLCQPRFRQYTFVGYFETGAEMALLLRESVKVGIPVDCSFRGMTVSSITFPNLAKVINLTNYLPVPLFKAAQNLNATHLWRWFPASKVHDLNIRARYKRIPKEHWWDTFAMSSHEEVGCFRNWHETFEGVFDCNEMLMDFAFHRSVLLLQVALSFQNECMSLENALLSQSRKYLLAGKQPVTINNESVYVCNNTPFSHEFPSLAAYAYWVFCRHNTIPLPIQVYQRNDNPCSRSSVMELGYLEWLREKKYPELVFALDGEQKSFLGPNGNRIYVDGFVPATAAGLPRDLIIEVLGCPWHACNVCFPNGSPFQNIVTNSRQIAEKARVKQLKKYGTVLEVWTHDIALKIKSDPEFANFIETFSKERFGSCSWRSAHGVGTTEAYGIFGHPEALKRDMKAKYGKNAEVLATQIDMHSHFKSTLMDIDHPVYSNAMSKNCLPIPMDVPKTVFGRRLFAPGSCPKECWGSKCANSGAAHSCSIDGCKIVCTEHFNPDFFSVVAGIAQVELVAPRNIVFPKIAIPIQRKQHKRAVNYFALCRTCAENTSRCELSEAAKRDGATLHGESKCVEEHSENAWDGDLHLWTPAQKTKSANFPRGCSSTLRLFDKDCDHSEEERKFEATLPLNELHYLLQCGYKVVTYHCVRYFAVNSYGSFDTFMRKLTKEKILAKGLPSTIATNDELQTHLDVVKKNCPNLPISGNLAELQEKWKANPIRCKLTKLFSCLIIGKFAARNDASFTTLVHSNAQFLKLSSDPLLQVRSYRLLGPRNLLVEMQYRPGGERKVTQSGHLLLASMITAAARIKMMKCVDKLFAAGYFTLYLGVDSLIVVQYRLVVPPLGTVVPMHETMTGCFGFVHRRVANAVIYGRLRYSVHNKDTNKIEFKFSGLSGVRSPGNEEMLASILHRRIAAVLLTEQFNLPIVVPKVQIGPSYDVITAARPKLMNFHIFEIRRQFFAGGIFKNRNYSRVKREWLDSTEVMNDLRLCSLIVSVPLGFRFSRVDADEMESRDEFLLSDLLSLVNIGNPMKKRKLHCY